MLEGPGEMSQNIPKPAPLNFLKILEFFWGDFSILLEAHIPPATTVPQDLINYYNELRKIWPLEQEAIEGYSKVTGRNYTDDSVLQNTLINKVIPTYKLFF